MKFLYNLGNFFAIIGAVSGINILGSALIPQNCQNSGCLENTNSFEKITPIVFASSTGLSIICMFGYLFISETTDESKT